VDYIELARKGFAIATGVPESKVTAEVHTSPLEKGSYKCRADLGNIVMEGAFTPMEEGDHGVVCIQVVAEGCVWLYPYSWHHLWNILSENPETAPY
jgi:hypothetical protein